MSVDQPLHSFALEVAYVSRHWCRLDFEESEYDRWGYVLESNLTPLIYQFVNEVDYSSEQMVLRAHKQEVYSAVLSDDGRDLYSCSADGTLIHWDLSTRFLKDSHGLVHRWIIGVGCWATSLALHNQSVLLDCCKIKPAASSTTITTTTVNIATESRLCAVCSDFSLRIWNAHSHQTIQEFRGHKKPINSVAFDPSGNHLVSGSDDRSVRIWNLETGNCDSILIGHESWVSTVCFVSDISNVVSGSWSSHIRVWNMIKEEETTTTLGSLQYECVLIIKDLGHPINYLCSNSLGTFVSCSSPNSTVIRQCPLMHSLVKIPRGSVCVRFKPKNSQLIALQSRDHTVYLVRLLVTETDEHSSSLSSHIVDSLATKHPKFEILGFFSETFQKPMDICFTQDGHRLVTVHGDGFALNVTLNELKPLDQRQKQL